MSSLPFCEKCSTLMDYVPGENDIGTMLRCETCKYETEIPSSLTKVQSTVYKKTNSSRIERSTIYDPTLKNSSKINCQNQTCPSLDPEQWGKRTDDGFLIQPDILSVNYNDSENRTNTYVCRICKTMFKPTGIKN